MIGIGTLIHAVIFLIIGGVIWWLLNWLLDYCQVPEPFHKVGKVILAIVAVLIVIAVLLSLAGVEVIRW